MSQEPFMIKVPGSSANLGPGFDSIGLAVNRYLILKVQQSDAWEFTSSSPGLEDVPSGEDNLICEVALHVAKELGYHLPPCKVHMDSDIPLARGLGSSASAIVAGVELANQLVGEPLTTDEKVRYAALWEGHPDNVAASVYGGLVIGTHTEDSTETIYGGVPEVDLVLLVPSEELKTKKARGVLPEELSYKDAVRASSVSNVLVAALLQGDFKLAGKMMTEDLFHHPYRLALVPHMKDVLETVTGRTIAYGAALSGAGPTMLCLTPVNCGEQLKAELQQIFPTLEIQVMKPAVAGVEVTRETIHVNE